ncbi:MAG: Ser-Thr-rich GPI-anchored membrane family protein [Lachnospiraceae bacterium]|nr:Ser-Thr-rich GPI-anchored membrane family protein [Lachnospiraceae bacterium]
MKKWSVIQFLLVLVLLMGSVWNVWGQDTQSNVQALADIKDGVIVKLSPIKESDILSIASTKRPSVIDDTEINKISEEFTASDYLPIKNTSGNPKAQPNLTCYQGSSAVNDFAYDTTTHVLDLYCSVINDGDANAGSYYIGWYLSTDQYITPTSDYLVTTNYDGSQTAGYYQNFSASKDLDIISIPDGTYYVGWIYDIYDTVDESSESDNFWYFSSPTITYKKDPDLTVTNPSGPSSAELGQSISVSCTVSNIGDGSSSSSYVGYFISSSQYGSENYLDDDYVSSLSAGGTSNENQTVTIPTNLSPGNYYITFFADYDHNISESNENNNINSYPITITSPPSYKVYVKNPSGTYVDGNELNSLELWKDGIYQSSVNPSNAYYEFTGLSANSTYNVDAYCTDMYVGSVSEYLSAGEHASETITVPNSGTLRVKTYYDDGTTPLEDVYVEVRSHEGTAWRSGTTLSTGYSSWGGSSVAYLFPNSHTGEYWYVYCFYNSSQVATARSVNITSGNETSISITTTVPAEGDINVTVKNIDGGLITIPTSNARVVLYDDSNPWVKITEDQTNSSAIANFYNIDFQTLNAEAYHNPVNPSTIFGEEYWGSIQFILNDDFVNQTITRHEPYSTNVSTYITSTGQQIESGGEVTLGKQLKFVVTVKNPSTGSRSIESRLVIDKDKITTTGNIDYDTGISSPISVSAGLTGTFTFYYTPTTIGDYYQVRETLAYFDNKYTCTDGTAWENTPFFTVVPPKGNLSVTVRNVDGELAEDGTEVLLKDGGVEIQWVNTVNGIAYFEGIPIGTYDMIKVYHPNPNSDYPEYWGQSGQITIIEGDTINFPFTRYMPYVSGIIITDLSNIQQYYFAEGKPVKIRVGISNDDIVNHEVSVKNLVDQSNTSIYGCELDSTIWDLNISANSSIYFDFIFTPATLGEYYVRPVNTFSERGLTDTYAWLGTPSFEVVPSTSPIALPSDISQQPLFLYPDTSVPYEIKAKYFDPSGANDLRYLYLRLEHPTYNDITLMYDIDSGNASAWAGSSGADYIISGSEVATKSNIIYNGNNEEGYEITWNFKLNDAWSATPSNIKFSVNAVDRSGQQTYEDIWEPDNSSSSFKQYGTTVLTHGWQHGLLDGFEWTTLVANAIQSRLGGKADIYVYNRSSNSFVESKYVFDIILGEMVWKPIDVNSDESNHLDLNREKILLFEWKRESNEFYEGHSEAAADALSALLLQGEEIGAWSLNNLHLIGHSRGTVVMGEVSQRLLTYKDGYILPHLTTLDPHDWGVEDADLLFWEELQVSPDKLVNPSLGNIVIPDNLNGHLPNSGICSWDGINWHDNYWQFGKDDYDELSDQLKLGGRGISGAMNVCLDNSTTAIDSVDHSGVWKWYLGTIDKNYNDDDIDIDEISYGNHKRNDGFEYSRLGFKSGCINFTSTYGSKTPIAFNHIQEGINNGNLDFGTSTSTTDVPGWNGFGGSSDAHSNDEKGLFIFDSGNNSIVHNLFYVPDVDTLYFSYRVDNIIDLLGTNDELLVYFDEDHTVHKKIVITEEMNNFETVAWAIPSFYKKGVHTLKIILQDPSKEPKAITSQVEIDNIGFYKDTKPNTPSNLQETFVVNTEPILSWSEFNDGGDGDTQIGYQVRMYRIGDNHLVYDTGLFSSTNENLHQYSPGSYEVSETLFEGVTYSWQVRYEDSGEDWSPWSELKEFIVPTNPFITISSPTNASKWQVGTEYTIQWDSNISGNCMITLWKGETFTSIANSIPISNEQFVWTVPVLTAGNDYRIRVQSEDPNVITYSDYFEIVEQPVASYIVLTEPDEGENWTAGTTERINWDHNITGNVKVELLINNSPYQTIFSNVSNQTNSSGYISWNIDPGLEGRNDYRVKVSSIDNSSVYGNSGLFTIEGQYIEVASPVAGEFWQRGVEHEIKWADNISDYVKIELWQSGEFKNTISSSTLSDGSLLWTPDLYQPVGEYQIKITSTLNSSLYAYSGLFNITYEPPAPYITLSRPNGGEQWQAGNTYNIYWADNFNENVLIELYRNELPFSTIADNEPSDGEYAWSISNSHFTGDDFKVKITKIDPVKDPLITKKTKSVNSEKEEVSCISSAPFSILEPFYISVITPALAHDVYAGTVDSLTWEDNIDEYVKIDLYKGLDFVATIKELTPSDGKEVWVVPEGLSGSDFNINITSVNDETITSLSDYFTIIIPELVPPVPIMPENDSFITDKSPDFDWNDVEGATEYVMLIDDNNQFTSPDSLTVTTSGYSSVSDMPTGTYYWKLRSRKPTYTSFYSIDYKFTIGNTPIPPKLSAPENGSSFADLTPTFNWSDITSATSYRIVIDNNSDFTTPEYDNTVSLSEFTPSINFDLETYYWRVYAVNDFGSSSSTPIWSFNLGEVPTAPKLYSPSNYSYLTEPRPEFEWSEVSSAISYRIMIDDNSDFSSPEVNAVTDISSYTPEDSLSLGIQYWKTAAINQYGEGAYSSIWRIEVELPLGAPNNVVISYDSGIINITWDVVDRATHYKVYSSNDPYGEFTLTSVVTTNAYSVDAGVTKLFYYIVASSEPLVKSVSANVENSVKSK